MWCSGRFHNAGSRSVDDHIIQPASFSNLVNGRPGAGAVLDASYSLTKLCAGKTIGSAGLMPACWRRGISFWPNAWNFSGDSQTSRTRSPSGVAPATCDRQPPSGHSASERRGCPLFPSGQPRSAQAVRQRFPGRLGDEFRCDNGRMPSTGALDRFPDNLPRQLTSFIGRKRELQDLKALLERSRLLTLTGPGRQRQDPARPPVGRRGHRRVPGRGVLRGAGPGREPGSGPLVDRAGHRAAGRG